MVCANDALLNDLAYCQGEGAIIHIGEMEVYSGYENAEQLRLLFTRLQDDHKTVIPIAGEYLPELVINSEDFTPVAGCVYRVQLVKDNDLGGISPFPLLTFSVTYVGYDTDTTAYDGLLVRFVKVFTMTSTQAVATEQYFTLAG